MRRVIQDLYVILRDEENHFEYKGWLVDLAVSYRGPVLEGYVTFKVDGRYKSTLRLLPSRMGEADARVALREMARKLIDEWAY